MSDTKVVTEKFKNKRLDSILVEMNLVSSRQKAVSLIMRGNVFVEEEKVSKPGKIIKINQKIHLKTKKKKVLVLRERKNLKVEIEDQKILPLKNIAKKDGNLKIF